MREYLLAFPYEPKLWPVTEGDYLYRVEAGDELSIGRLGEVLDTLPNSYYYKHFQQTPLKDVPFSEVERLGRPEKGTILYDTHGYEHEFTGYLQMQDDKREWVVRVVTNCGTASSICKDFADLYTADPALLTLVVAKPEPKYTLQIEGRTPINDHSYVSLYLADNTDVEKAVALLPRPYQHLQLIHLKNQKTAIVVTYNEATTENNTN